MSHIILIGEDWKTLLGQRAQYLEPRIGIIIGIGSEIREEVQRMQVMSANEDLAMPALLAIVDEFQARAFASGKHRMEFIAVAEKIKGAKFLLEDAAKTMEAIRRGKS